METLKILLIDDDKADRMQVCRLLKRADSYRFEIQEAVNREAGLALLKSEIFDCLLLDYRLPDADGLQIVRELVSEPKTCPPIVMLTVVDDESIGVKAVAEGAQDYQIKGRVDSALLIRSIRYAIERKKNSQVLLDYSAGLENLSRQLQARNQEMAEDLALARGVQESMIPDGNAILSESKHAKAIRFEHAYHPCETLGGDFFDISLISDNKIAVFVGDVMGHGVRAALVAAVVRGLLEELRREKTSPHRVLEGLNKGMIRMFSPRDRIVFVTAIYFVMDITTGEAQIANAGHPHPLVVGDGRKLPKELKSTKHPRCPALGIFDEQKYTSAEFTINQGDRILFFTDGLFDNIRGDNGTEHGLERLREVIKERVELSLKEFIDELVRNAEEFSEKGELLDDVCVVGMEIRPKSNPTKV